MRQGTLKSLTHILNDAYDWKKCGLYYKIQVAPLETIGFRKPYEKYLGTRVTIKRKMNRKGTWRTGVYTVFAQNGNPIFIAHRSWFSVITHDVINDASTASMTASGARYSEPVLPLAPAPTQYHAPKIDPDVNKPELGDLSWEELFDI